MSAVAQPLRLPVAFTAVVGYVTFAFAAIGIYLFLGAASAATGGESDPLGRAIAR